MKKNLLLFTALGLSQLSYAQLTNGRISPPLAGAVSNNQIAFVVGKIYVEPQFSTNRLVVENDTIAQQEQVAEQPLVKKLVIYPNPVDSNLYFFTEDHEMPQTVTVYESGGRQVFSGAVKNGCINIGFLTKGSYLLKTNLDPIQQYTILKN